MTQGKGHTEPTDGVLVQRALSGNDAAFNLLVLRYQRQVYSLAYRMLASADDAADIVQETFIRAYGALASFRQDASFLTWLYKIASNLCIDLIRSRYSKRTIPFEADGGDEWDPPATDRTTLPEESALSAAVSDIVHREVLNLPDRYRRVVVMRHLQGQSIDEIAERLGIPSGTVKTHLFRGREMLRERLQAVLGVDSDGREQAS